MRVRHRVRIHTSGDEASHVRHVHEQIRADLVCDGAEARPIDDLRICGKAADDHFRLAFQGDALDFVVIDHARLVHAVGNDVEEFAGDVGLGAVGEMAAVRQRHAQHGVARLQQCEIHCLVGLRAGVRLHVRIVRTVQLLQAFDRQRLGHIHIFAAAVITLADIPLGVFVGELAALRFHHPRAGVVLGGDELDVIFLTAIFRGNRGGQFGIEIFNTDVAREHRDSRGRVTRPL